MKRTKTNIALSFLVVLLFTLTAGIALAAPLMEVPTPADKIFVPDAYDDNDRVQIILHGDYPDTCYRPGRTRVETDKEERIIRVTANSYTFQSKREEPVFCLESITPFLQEVDLGLLPEGDYTVVFKGAVDDGRKRDGPVLMSVAGPEPASLRIRRHSTEAPDDHLYANVLDAALVIDAAGKQKVVMTGEQPHWLYGCQRLVEVEAYFSPEDVLVVKPITEMTEGPACDAITDDRRFVIEQSLSQPFTTEGMLHIKALNSTTVNRLVPSP